MVSLAMVLARSQVLLQRSPIYQDITYGSTITVAERARYGVSIVTILETIDRVITVPHSISFAIFRPHHLMVTIKTS